MSTCVDFKPTLLVHARHVYVLVVGDTGFDRVTGEDDALVRGLILELGHQHTRRILRFARSERLHVVNVPIWRDVRHLRGKHSVVRLLFYFAAR